jgi:gliding motility associated protien GldN
MNPIKSLLIIGSLLLSGITGEAVAQSVQSKPTSSTENPGSFPEVSFQKSKIAESQETRGEDVLWKRDVYRMVDLTSGINGAFYYPIEPTPERKNLFCTIFDQIANGKLTAYEFLDGREIFNETYTLKFKDMLKRFEIPYKEKINPKKANSSLYEIDAVDIPSAEVTLFYIKETYYLDQRNSSMHVKTMAICPVLIRTDEVGEVRKYPMFWIPFEKLKVFLSQIPMAADTINTASRMNAYDFFNEHRYTGDIYKVSNLKNQTLWDYCKTPDEIKVEQNRLEKELENMNDKLWEPSQREIKEAEEAIQKEKQIAAKNKEKAKAKTKKAPVSKEKTIKAPATITTSALTESADTTGKKE